MMRQDDVIASIAQHKQGVQVHNCLFCNYEARCGEWNGVPYVSFNTNPGGGRYARRVIYLVDCAHNQVLMFTNENWTEDLKNLYQGNGNKPTASQFADIWDAQGIVKDVSDAEEAIEVLDELYDLYDEKLKKNGAGH